MSDTALELKSAEVALREPSMMEMLARAAADPRRKPTLWRFMPNVLPEPMSGCWLWMGGVNRADYGQFSLGKGVNRGAHRVSYALHKGDIPQGLQLDHLCRVHCCVNPAHLEPVTLQENLARGESRFSTIRRQAAKTHCKFGHEFSEANTYRRGGHRYCRACHNARTLAEYHKRKRPQ